MMPIVASPVTHDAEGQRSTRRKRRGGRRIGGGPGSDNGGHSARHGRRNGVSSIRAGGGERG